MANPEPGEVYWMDFPLQGGGTKRRPVLVVSRAGATALTGVVIVVSFTTMPKAEWTTVEPVFEKGGLNDADSVVVPEIIVSDDVESLRDRAGRVTQGTLLKVRQVIQNALV